MWVMRVVSSGPRSEAWCSGLTCSPVKAETAGSNPVASAEPRSQSMRTRYFFVPKAVGSSPSCVLPPYTCHENPEMFPIRTGRFDAPCQISRPRRCLATHDGRKAKPVSFMKSHIEFGGATLHAACPVGDYVLHEYATEFP